CRHVARSWRRRLCTHLSSSSRTLGPCSMSAMSSLYLGNLCRHWVVGSATGRASVPVPPMPGAGVEIELAGSRAVLGSGGEFLGPLLNTEEHVALHHQAARLHQVLVHRTGEGGTARDPDAVSTDQS